jgi:hypothetical protein
LSKNLLFILLFLSCEFACESSFSQQVAEKLLSGIPQSIARSLYELKYDKKTGSYLYPLYDTAGGEGDKIMIVTPKGVSRKFFGSDTYYTFFDSYGNIYTTAFDFKDDSVYTYYLLKNSEVLGTYENINYNWSEKNGVLYFSVKESGKTYFTALDLSTGIITKGKGYDDISFVYIPDLYNQYHGVPVTYPGFTPDGRPYYCASEGNKKFMVIGGEEQKNYTDIDQYYCVPDNNGDIVYIASDSGSIYESSGEHKFVVQRDKEYRKFGFVNGPVIFDENNNPVYAAGNMEKDTYPQTVFSGNDPLSKKYSSGITELQFTPSGKLAFIGSSYTDKINSEFFLVIDGKETKQPYAVYSLKFTDNDRAVLLETEDQKQFIVKDNKVISDSYDNILFYKTSGNTLYYAGLKYEKNSKGGIEKNYFHAGSKKFGPFNSIVAVTGPDGFIIIDNSGNYIFDATKTGQDDKNTDYDYIYTGKGKSGPYYLVDNIALYKGRTIFTGSKNQGDNYSPAAVYVDLKPVTREYEDITNYELDTKMGIITFTGSKDGNIYFVEVKL